ncbi:hypothetical protein M752DRAFT_80345 [Aspergillus phoenicis ATCC 13157]|uniref:Uncharacterized protein n=1 Tax=Aspergillus phoenicis ATCC 13157 TaxID=1353007 RepID=A0A370P8H1_ASPPH|nr:hypothetical protein M752DRAFT_80345 [Aspergillus phoenicis ATCC 13157]
MAALPRVGFVSSALGSCTSRLDPMTNLLPPNSPSTAAPRRRLTWSPVTMPVYMGPRGGKSTRAIRDIVRPISTASVARDPRSVVRCKRFVSRAWIRMDQMVYLATPMGRWGGRIAVYQSSRSIGGRR